MPEGSRLAPVSPAPFELLSLTDAPAVADLYARCDDYFILQDGEPPTLSDAIELFSDVPSSKRPEDQFVLGWYSDEKLDAVAAVLMDYPAPRDWYLGLLLIDPALRGQRAGRGMYAGIELWAANRGAKQMLLAVLEENEAAHRFWRSLDFHPIRTVEPALFKQRLHRNVELARPVNGGFLIPSLQ